MLTFDPVDESLLAFWLTTNDLVSILFVLSSVTTLDAEVSLLDDCELLLLGWLELEGATLVVVLESAIEELELTEEELTEELSELAELTELEEELVLALALVAVSGLNPWIARRMSYLWS